MPITAMPPHADPIHLWIPGLPQEEREPAQLLVQNVRDLDCFYREFWSGLALFDHCTEVLQAAHRKYSESKTEQDPYGDESARNWIDVCCHWEFKVARDCALTVFHFGRAKDGFHQTLGKCPTVRAIIETRDASRLFESLFPYYVEMRDAITHPTTNTAQNLEKHSIKESIHPWLNIAKDGYAIFSNMLAGRTFSSTWKGRLFSIEISETTAEKMALVRDAYLGALGMAAAEINKSQQPRLESVNNKPGHSH